jgi:hypothetical protein
MTSARKPPARATTSQSAGAASPPSENGVVNSTGSGFQEGPATVFSSSRATSRPQLIHDHGS